MLRGLVLTVVMTNAVAISFAYAQDASPLTRIAFGSCANQELEQPIWDAVVAAKPEAFVFLGDNIYGDSDDVQVLYAKWQRLGTQPGYQALKRVCPNILATWDDHDYGRNDAGVEYPRKRESQQLFLDFFEEPIGSARRKSEGIYDAKVFGPEGKRVQFILLDTRYFRSPLVKTEPRGEKGEGLRGPYGQNTDPNATILGDAQWQWLEEQLRVPAELRIVASSIQVIAEEQGWEKWANFPRERERLFKLIEDTNANGVIFLSGDRHRAEISRHQSAADYPLFDVTSSALNRPSTWANERNRHRIGLMYMPVNFGMLRIDWTQLDPVVRMQICDIEGNVALQHRVKLSELR